MAAREVHLVGDETLSARGSQDLTAELEKSRESAARLLENLAQKIGAAPVVRSAAENVQRAAHYVQAHSVRDIFTGIDRAARRRPVAAIGIAVAAGFLLGRAIRSR
jgi:ElaB/YqjD/DUF883 family membrane-anchored ribosome-binding protein